MENREEAKSRLVLVEVYLEVASDHINKVLSFLPADSEEAQSLLILKETLLLLIKSSELTRGKL